MMCLIRSQREITVVSHNAKDTEKDARWEKLHYLQYITVYYSRCAGTIIKKRISPDKSVLFFAEMIRLTLNPPTYIKTFFLQFTKHLV